MRVEDRFTFTGSIIDMRFANVLLAQQQQRLLLMRRLCFADHLQQPVGSRGDPFRQLHLLPTFSNLQQFHNAFANDIQQKRFGSKKTVKKKFKKDMEYEDEEPELTVRRGQKIKKMDREKREQQLSEEGKTVKFCILSRRLDAILSGSALGKSRTWLDKEISRGSVRVNEHVITKKSHELEEGDCAELFLKPVDENPKLAVVHQINVLKCPFDPELGYEFQVHVYMDLVTDNWKHGADGRKKYGSKESEEDNDQ